MKLLHCVLITVLISLELEQIKAEAGLRCSSEIGGGFAETCSEPNAYCCGKHRNQCCYSNPNFSNHWLMGGAMLLIAFPIVLSGWCFPGSLCCLCCCDYDDESSGLLSGGSSSSSSSSSSDSSSSSSSD